MVAGITVEPAGESTKNESGHDGVRIGPPAAFSGCDGTRMHGVR